MHQVPRKAYSPLDLIILRFYSKSSRLSSYETEGIWISLLAGHTRKSDRLVQAFALSLPSAGASPSKLSGSPRTYVSFMNPYVHQNKQFKHHYVCTTKFTNSALFGRQGLNTLKNVLTSEIYLPSAGVNSQWFKNIPNLYPENHSPKLPSGPNRRKNRKG